ncbi:MAG: hypothetical protein HOB78_03750 [Flavobacteriales bacterium]|jgi:hypothetical protein|nr:hypothetical protein [Flavobacteriales bacterium]
MSHKTISLTDNKYRKLNYPNVLEALVSLKAEFTELDVDVEQPSGGKFDVSFDGEEANIEIAIWKLNQVLGV